MTRSLRWHGEGCGRGAGGPALSPLGGLLGFLFFRAVCVCVCVCVCGPAFHTFQVSREKAVEEKEHQTGRLGTGTPLRHASSLFPSKRGAVSHGEAYAPAFGVSWPPGFASCSESLGKILDFPNLSLLIYEGGVNNSPSLIGWNED